MRKVLPKKWCVRFGTEEQFEILKNYFSKKNSQYKNIG